MTKAAELFIQENPFNSSHLPDPLDFYTSTKINFLSLNHKLQKALSDFSLEDDHLELVLKGWKEDRQHGIEHSLSVFNKMYIINGADDLQITDGDMSIHAILHDFAEHLPLQKAGKEIPRDERSRRHPLYMAYLIRAIGNQLGVEDAHQLAINIDHHDDFYLRPSQEEMSHLRKIVSPAGQLLADADRLVEDTEGSIERNRGGSLGRWYFFRQNLMDRKLWKPRTGGLFDGFSALALEFVSPAWRLYTQTGQRIYQERAKSFEVELVRYYQRAFTEGWTLIDTALKTGCEIRYGLRDKSSMIEVPLDQLEYLEKGQTEIRSQLTRLVNTPVRNKSKDGRNYYGYSVCLTDPQGVMHWLDPSILIFPSVEAIKDTFQQAIAASTPTP